MKANVQLPGARRACVPLLLLSGAAAAATCLVEGPAIYVLPVLGAGLAVIVVRLCRRPPRGVSDAAPPVLPRSARLSSSALKLTAFALLGVNAVLGLAALRVVSRCHGCRQIVEHNLRAVWTGLKLHHKHVGQYPESLGDLVLDSTCITLTLESPFDPEVGWVPTVRDVIYTSYMYRPGAGPWVTDPTLILAHDRAAFSRLRERLFQTPGRFVLFADGHVAGLEPAAFSAALEADRARRRTLGWPVDPPEPPVRRMPGRQQVTQAPTASAPATPTTQGSTP